MNEKTTADGPAPVGDVVEGEQHGTVLTETRQVVTLSSGDPFDEGFFAGVAVLREWIWGKFHDRGDVGVDELMDAITDECVQFIHRVKFRLYGETAQEQSHNRVIGAHQVARRLRDIFHGMTDQQWKQVVQDEQHNGQMETLEKLLADVRPPADGASG